MISVRKGLSWCFILFLIIMMGCAPKEDHTYRKKDIIPEKDMIPILVDIHMANAMFSLSSLRATYPGTDSISNYQDILNQYGYKIKDFNRTLSYYEQHMDELESIYEQVTKRLQDIEREVMGGDQPMMDAPGRYNVNLWKTQTEYHLPREGARNKIPFSFPVHHIGVYTLTARIRLFQDDQSVHPEIQAYFWHDDGTKEGKSTSLKTQPLRKDNQVHLYTISGTLNDTTRAYLKGFILDDKNTDTLFVKHADIFDIRIDFKPQQKIPK